MAKNRGFMLYADLGITDNGPVQRRRWLVLLGLFASEFANFAVVSLC